MYHGTNTKCVDRFKNIGFLKTSSSCAVQDYKQALGYGDKVIAFKYQYTILLKDLFWFCKEYFGNKLIVSVAGFKPKKIKLYK